ncbi:MAG: hypothetical protein IIA45_15300 [Bacteroidetes bacterium]|nr:hypothetical protein [Bacteroidota bacterium]
MRRIILIFSCFLVLSAFAGCNQEQSSSDPEQSLSDPEQSPTEVNVQYEAEIDSLKEVIADGEAQLKELIESSTNRRGGRSIRSDTPRIIINGNVRMVYRPPSQPGILVEGNDSYKFYHTSYMLTSQQIYVGDDARFIRFDAEEVILLDKE